MGYVLLVVIVFILVYLVRNFRVIYICVIVFTYCDSNVLLNYNYIIVQKILITFAEHEYLYSPSFCSYLRYACYYLMYK